MRSLFLLPLVIAASCVVGSAWAEEFKCYEEMTCELVQPPVDTRYIDVCQVVRGSDKKGIPQLDLSKPSSTGGMTSIDESYRCAYIYRSDRMNPSKPPVQKGPCGGPMVQFDCGKL